MFWKRFVVGVNKFHAFLNIIIVNLKRLRTNRYLIESVLLIKNPHHTSHTLPLLDSCFIDQQRRLIVMEEKEFQKNTTNTNCFNTVLKKIIQLANAECSYQQGADRQLILKEINLNIYKGDFVGVFGKVGSGKTSFLNLLANQMPQTSGKIKLAETAFQQAEPYVISGSIQQNILFGKEMRTELYTKAIIYSCLENDLKLMKFGDKTILEEGGLNLSGRQRTRLCLARAIYAEKPILLLDDPLSSLDLRVIENIMNNLKQLNKEGTTIILATHHLELLAKCDHVIEIKDRRITLLTREHLLFTKSFQGNKQIQKEHKQAQQRVKHSQQTDIIWPQKQQQQQGKNKQVSQTNKQNTGFFISMLGYIFRNKYNYIFMPITILCYFISEGLYVTLLSFLNQFDRVQAGTHSIFHNKDAFWLTLGLMSLSIFIFQIFRTVLLNITLQLANKSLHDQALGHLLKANILDLDRLGTKQITDKFSTDLGMLDVAILPDLSANLIIMVLTIVQIVMISLGSPIILIFIFSSIIPLIIWYQRFSKVVSILKDLQLRHKGPVIASFSETLVGLVPIENMHAKDFMISRLISVLNTSIIVGLKFRMVLRAFLAYTVFFITILVVVSFFVLISMTDPQNSQKFTFAVVVLVSMGEYATWLMSLTTKIKSNLNGVRKIVSLQNVKVQQDGQVKDLFLKDQSEECLDEKTVLTCKYSFIILDKVSLKYGKTYALKDISLRIKTGQKVALVGRTGSGKSSIIQVLYRLVDLEKGSKYFINGKDAFGTALETLRRNFKCMPQTPFIFSDSIRCNIDPEGQHSDEQLMNALEKVQLLNCIQELDNGLDSLLATGESKLSAGHKQLLCLARTLLDKQSYLILDEATANIDQETDVLIQQLIRQQFSGRTVITVTHRLNTVIDYDLIVVLSQGKIIQSGSAWDLWRNKGEFHSMIMESGQKKHSLIAQLQDRNNKRQY